MFNNKGLKKVTKRDRYGNQMTYEFEAPVKPLDPTALMKAQMEQANMPTSFMEVPPIMEIEIDDDYADHPGEPRGTDTVPAWLTPGEFVMNAEAVDMYGPEIEAMNEDGRQLQRAQGGTVPRYADGGPVYLRGGSGRNVRRPTEEEEIVAALEAQNNAEPPSADAWINDQLLDNLRMVESSGNPKAVNKRSGASGAYQWMPQFWKEGAEIGYGVDSGPFDPFDEEVSRQRTEQYLRGLQRQYPDWSQEDILRAYNWGPGNVRKYKAGTRTDMPEEAQMYPGKILNYKADGGPVYLNHGGPHGRMKGSNAVAGDTDWFGQSQAKQAFEPAVVPPTAEMVAPVVEDDDIQVTGNIPELNQELVQSTQTIKEIEAAMRNDPRNAGHLIEGLQLAKEQRDRLKNEYDRQAAAEGTVMDESGVHEVRNVPDWTERDNARVADEDAVLAQMEADRNAVLSGEVPEEKVPELVGEVAKRPDYPMAVLEEAKPKIDETVIAEQETGEYSEPDEGDVGETIAAGQDAANTDPSTLERVGGMLGGVFGDALDRMFDQGGLAEAAIMYLGSRALGYSHGGSLNFVAKRYAQQIDAKNANAQKMYQEGKYTKDSIRAYEMTGDASQLQAQPKPPKRIKAEGSTVYTVGSNKPVKVYEYERADGTKYVGDYSGNEIDQTKYHSNAEKSQGTKEWHARVDKFGKEAGDILKGLQDRANPDSSEFGFKTDIVPQAAAHKVGRWAAKNDVPPEDLATVIEGAYRDALNHAQASGKKPKDITPYLNQQVVRATVGNPDLFTAKEQNEDIDGPTYIDAGKLSDINMLINGRLKAAGSNATATNIANQYYTAMAAEYAKLKQENPKEFAKLQTQANGDENGFFVFIAKDLGYKGRK